MTSARDQGLGSRTVEGAAAPARPFFWSVRRELFENRSVTIAPLIVAAVVLLASLLTVLVRLGRMESLPEAGERRTSILAPFSLAPAPIILACFVVGLFYAIDALYGERRDRSILFWKSLPVSDRTTVLAKASVPLLVLPIIGFVLGLAVQVALVSAGSLLFVGKGLSPALLWTTVNPVVEAGVMAYGIAVHTLWYAPIFCWLMLVSAWARRAPLVWAVLPVLVPGVFESVALRGDRVCSAVQARVLPVMHQAFDLGPGDHAAVVITWRQLAPARFLTTPALWLGLAAAGAFLAIAVWLRRNREPV